MLVFSKSERYIILTFLVVGLFSAGLFYYGKISGFEVKTININESDSLIDINTASAQQLERLPGIGPVLAQDIVVYRQRTGLFKRIEELKHIKGIGDKKFEKIKDLIRISE
ncbi:MAG: helix-hairpin-helix domain-containing protein [Candidatus Omnitrophica bacterium]|nr:helix-hairpin-helix domain-containing protein [Candidatus Omnitrophota bacterium]